MILFEELVKGRALLRVSTADLGEGISGTLCQAVYPAYAQRQQVEMGASELRGKGPHLERIYRLFLKAF